MVDRTNTNQHKFHIYARKRANTAAVVTRELKTRERVIRVYCVGWIQSERVCTFGLFYVRFVQLNHLKRRKQTAFILFIAT